MKILGFDIRFHWSLWAIGLFFLLPPIIFLDFYGFIFYFFIFTSLYSFVLWHELAHASAARLLGYNTKEIVLNFLGGWAAIDMKNLKPSEEIVISLAGPLSNFYLGLVFFWLLIGVQLVSFNLEVLKNALATWIILNLIIGLFNLIPAYPLDGGRVLRSGLLLALDTNRATKIYAVISILFALLFVGVGIFTFNPGLILVAIIIGFVNVSSVRSLNSDK